MGSGAGLPFMGQLVAWAGVLWDEARVVTNLGHAIWEQSSEQEAGGAARVGVEGEEGPCVQRASSVSASRWQWGMVILLSPGLCPTVSNACVSHLVNSELILLFAFTEDFIYPERKIPALCCVGTGWFFCPGKLRLRTELSP